MTDNTGAAQDSINYDAWGNIASEANANVRGNYAYTGGTIDTATGLLHLGGRDLSLVTHIWIEPDPIGFGGGQSNLVQYVGNGPTNGTDASGLYEAPNFYDKRYWKTQRDPQSLGDNGGDSRGRLALDNELARLAKKADPLIEMNKASQEAALRLYRGSGQGISRCGIFRHLKSAENSPGHIGYGT